LRNILITYFETMIKITFPDGNSKEFNKGITPLEIAKDISEGLAKQVFAAKINDELWDLSRPIQDDSTLQLHKWDDEEAKHAYWHSSAHLMAEALEALFPGVKFGIGPAVENGFYYDVDLGGKEITNEDLTKIEAKMVSLAQNNNPFQRKNISKKEVAGIFKEKGDEYKSELIEELEEGEITVYEHGNFTDLCKGPHLPDTGYIKAIKLLSIAGAYWRGDEKNKQLTRIYGISFPKQKQLDEYITLLEEAKKRDHRKLGKELELFTFDDEVGPGLPLWLPKGAAIIEELEKLAKTTETQAGYSRVRTPHIAKESMYLTSGHLPYYEDSMFPPMEF